MSMMVSTPRSIRTAVLGIWKEPATPMRTTMVARGTPAIDSFAGERERGDEHDLLEDDVESAGLGGEQCGHGEVAREPVRLKL